MKEMNETFLVIFKHCVGKTQEVKFLTIGSYRNFISSKLLTFPFEPIVTSPIFITVDVIPEKSLDLKGLNCFPKLVR